MPAEVITVNYVCAQCGAKDSDRVFPDTAIAPALNCWSCGAGRRFPNAHDAVMNKQGMFPVVPPARSRRQSTQGVQ